MHRFRLAILVTAAVTLLLAIADHFLDGNFWSGWTLEPSVLNHCFCEHNYMDRFIRQPLNTWSNLAFLFFGVAILQQSFRSENESERKIDPGNYLSRNRVIGIFYGILLCILFIGSFLFHASLTVFFGITDMIGTYGIPLFLGMIALSRISVYHRLLRESTAAALCVAITFLLGFALAIRWIVLFNMIATFSFLLLMGGLGGVYLYSRKDLQFNLRLFALIVLVMFLSCGIWIIDHNNILCDPYSNLQGHSFWHVLDATAAYLMYQFFYSEKNLKNS